MPISRRDFLVLALGGAVAGAPIRTRDAQASSEPAHRMHRLSAAPGRVSILGLKRPSTAVWCYNDAVPGPLLRIRQGERARIVVENGLETPTTVHWHGLRVPNAMDGVPGLTQAPIGPGERFVYEFMLRDVGTYWYHPHFQSSEQLDRGLAGVLLVEEARPPEVDRDIVWVLDDWRLTPRAAISEDFGDLHDASHAGRLGNTATINGVVPDALRVRAGERIRLRLVNTANAWIFGLDFNGHAPMVVAYDGRAVTPHAPPGGLLAIGPSMRVDVVIDMQGKPGQRYEVTDRYYPRRQYKLTDLVYEDGPPMRDSPLDASLALTPPVLPEPVLADAERHVVRFSGGAMGRMASAHYHGELLAIRELAGRGKVWAVNGVVASGNVMEPALRLARGRSHVIAFENDSVFPHPVHLHGHAFRVLRRDGAPEPHTPWRDTVLLGPRERVEVALVADNPGKWMLHCHIPEHQEAGMMAIVEVA